MKQIVLKHKTNTKEVAAFVYLRTFPSEGKTFFSSEACGNEWFNDAIEAERLSPCGFRGIGYQTIGKAIESALDSGWEIVGNYGVPNA